MVQGKGKPASNCGHILSLISAFGLPQEPEEARGVPRRRILKKFLLIHPRKEISLFTNPFFTRASSIFVLFPSIRSKERARKILCDHRGCSRNDKSMSESDNRHHARFSRRDITICFPHPSTTRKNADVQFILLQGKGYT